MGAGGGTVSGGSLVTLVAELAEAMACDEEMHRDSSGDASFWKLRTVPTTHH